MAYKSVGEGCQGAMKCQREPISLVQTKHPRSSWLRHNYAIFHGKTPFFLFIDREIFRAGDPFDLDVPCQNHRTEIGEFSYK
ncbi:hypothetical protein D3C76_1632710 [compost metagenome]